MGQPSPSPVQAWLLDLEGLGAEKVELLESAGPHPQHPHPRKPLDLTFEIWSLRPQHS